MEAQYQIYRALNSVHPNYVSEQSIWRIKEVEKKSPQCLKDGSCRVCGCDTIELTFGQMPCEGNCYPPRMDEQTWNKFKKTIKWPE